MHNLLYGGGGQAGMIPTEEMTVPGEGAESACRYYSVSAGIGSGTPLLYHFWL